MYSFWYIARRGIAGLKLEMPKILALAALLLALIPSAHANTDGGLKAPEALKEKWGEVKELTVSKYEKVRDSDIGQKVKRKAIEAKNSDTAKSIWAKAGDLWSKALLKGKSLLVSADQKLHEKVLDAK
jgi:hypothetical protein